MAKKKKTKAKIKTKKKAKKRKPSSVGSKSGRNSNGKFVKGNRNSVGNKGNTNEKAKALKTILLKTITEKDIKAIVKKMVEQSKLGDDRARKELFDRLWGRAIQEVDLGENTAKTIFDILAVCGLGNGDGN